MLISFSAWLSYFFHNVFITRSLLLNIYNAFFGCNVLAMLYHTALFGRPYLMDLDSTNGTFINVSVLVMCVNLARLCSCSDNSVMLISLFLNMLYLCSKIASNLVAIMNYLKKIRSSLAIVGMIITTEEARYSFSG